MDRPQRLAALILFVLVIACTPAPTPAAVAPDSSPVPTSTALPPSPQAIIPSPTTTLPALTPTASLTATLTPTVRAACQEEGGRISLFELESELLPRPMPFRVYLPPCYDTDLDRSYGVIYLIHGQSYNDDQWDRLGIDEAADRLIGNGTIPETIIVMPRDRELSTQPDTNHFADSVAQELVPWIDERFRTIPQREYRAVGGLSRGGGWALHIALSEWELFGALGTHSLAIFWIDTYSIKSWLSEIPAGETLRIYMDIGHRDRPELMESNVWFEKLLTERGIPHEWHLFTGYHQESYWEEHLEDYLKWYTEAW